MKRKLLWFGTGLAVIAFILVLLALAGQTRTAAPASPTALLCFPWLARGPLPDLVVTSA